MTVYCVLLSAVQQQLASDLSGSGGRHSAAASAAADPHCPRQHRRTKSPHGYVSRWTPPGGRTSGQTLQHLGGCQ